MVVDIIIIIVILALVLIGKKRGLMRCLVSVVSFIISMVLALALCKPLGNFLIQNTSIDNSIKSIVENSLKIENVKIDTENKLPQAIEKYINNATDSINETKDNIQQEVSNGIATHIMYGISYIIIFIITKIIIVALRFLSRIVEKLPVINKMNELGGAILGGIQGAIIVYITLTLISVLSPMMQDTIIIDQINDSYIGNYIYNNNLFL